MSARIRETFQTTLVFAVLFSGVFFSIAFSLPKEKKEPAPAKTVRPVGIEQTRVTPIVLDDFEPRSSPAGASSPVSPGYRYLGPARVETAASPYVDVKVGIPETPGGNNHMRRQVALSPNGVVHMVYGVFDGNFPSNSGSSADSAKRFLYFYNAYNCGGSNALRNGPEDVQMLAPGPPADPRPRVMNQGGIFIPPGAGTPVVYGNRYILRTETPRADDVSRRGGATMRDSVECLGMFSMDTTLVPAPPPTITVHWVMYPLNESTWVATCRPSSNPPDIGWSYTTDRGKSWTAVALLPTYSPWFNSTDITGRGNTVYVVSVADPNDPSAFETTERPCYLKGTYNPLTGSLTWGTITDITGNFELPGFKANMIGISALMIGDTLHVIWTDWNNYIGNGFPGPGGHAHHAAVLPDGTIQGPHKITEINIDGRLPDRSYTLFGFAVEAWPMVSLSYNPTTKVLYGLWSAPPDDGNFGWADYEQYHALACYDIFMSASPNNGRGWDDATNITQTNNPGCDGTPGNPCSHEDFFSAAEFADSVVNVVAMVQRYPGFQELAGFDTYPDPGPYTQPLDAFRLYRVPARTPIPSVRADLGVLPNDTTRLDTIRLVPRGGVINVPLRLSNLGLADFVLDSAKLNGTLNDGYLVTTQNAVSNTFLPVGQHFDFDLTFNSNGVGPNNQGVRSGFLQVYVHSDDAGVPPENRNKVIQVDINAFVMVTLCLNRKIQIHSASNFTDIGTQGTIKGTAGLGMYNPLEDMDNFYDGGVWFANSALNAPPCASGPRKVSRQLFNDKFMRCVADGILDSVKGTGSYYNLYLKSIGTDISDTTLVWQNIWEQSTHPDSSEFLIQNTRVINVGTTPIDSLAMGAIYDIDVSVGGAVSGGENVGGDTTLSHLGRTWWLGWIGGIDIAIDTCSPGAYIYGFVVIPGSIGNPGETVRPRGAVVYEQAGFAYNIDCGNPHGGDTLAQRYSWNLNVAVSTRDRAYDSLTGVWQDTAGCTPGNCFICGFLATGPPYRTDMGYLTIAKKVYNFPVNGGGSGLVARYGLDGLAASVDTFFSGPGESYTIIHVVSAGGGLSGLMDNAKKGIDWYVNHANNQVGSRQTWVKGDLTNDGQLSAADVVAELNYVFANIDVYAGTAIPLCAADLNNTGDLSAADVVLLLNGTFSGAGCTNCLRPCF